MIKNCCVSDTIKFFKNKIKHYNLNTDWKYDKKIEFVQFGLYLTRDYENIINNESNIVIVIWGGTDLIKLMNNFWKNKTKIFMNVLKRDNIYHIAQSLDHYNKLKSLKLKKIHYKKLFFIEDKNHIGNFIIKPEKKGNKIYVYDGIGSEVYNVTILKQLQAKLKKYQFIFSSECVKKNIQQKDMYKIYKECFICLRLTNYDGNGMTVFEAGLCGVPSVHNGDFPDTYKWDKNNIDNIIKIIDSENNNNIDKNIKLQEKYISLLNNALDNSWLNKKFFLDNKILIQ